MAMENDWMYDVYSFSLIYMHFVYSFDRQYTNILFCNSYTDYITHFID